MYSVRCRQKHWLKDRHKSSPNLFIQSGESACYADLERVNEKVRSIMQSV